MALETIDLHSRIIVARAAKMLRTANGDRLCVRPMDRVAAYAFLEAVLLGPHASQHGLITLVLEQGHMIAAHEVGIFNATLALSSRDVRLRYITCRYGHAHETDQCYRCHNNDIAATSHDLLSEPHADVTRWANILTNVTTDAFRVIGVDIATHRGLRFLDAEDGILGTKDHTVVTFETHAATHAPVSFLFGLFL